MRAALVAIVAAVVFGVSMPAQAQQQPARPVARPDPASQPGQPRRPVRDPRQPPAEGTATIRGRVIDAATGAAIPRAKVRTMGGRDQRSARLATADTEGVFTLTKVQAGSLMLQVEKSGYLGTMYPDRRRSMRAAGVTITDGQTIENITIALSRGGAITGRIIDVHGDPLENVIVQAIPAGQTNKIRPVMLGGMRAFQNTNDIGEFRLSRLEPGPYYLLAMPPRRQDVGGEEGTVPGRTYYPGVASIDQAQPITLERGSTMAGIDFQMLDTSLTKVSGFVLNAKGMPGRNGHVTARATSATKGTPAGMGIFMGDGGTTSVDQNGAFELNLQPGEYIIEGSAPQGDVSTPQGRIDMDRGQVRLMVGGESISGVTLSAGVGGTISGRFVFKGTTPPPASSAGFNIGFTGPEGGTMGEDCRASSRPVINADGTFTADNLWGACQLRAMGMTKGWTFESVMHNGNDLTSRAIEFGAGRSITGVEIIYSDRVGDVAVTVADERGTPTLDYVAVVFPVEKEKWGDQRFARSQVRSATSAQTGGALGDGASGRVMATASLVQGGPYGGMINSTFSGPGMVTGSGNSFAALLAGDYFVVALEDAAFEDLRDAEYLERLSQMATRVSVSAGGQQSVQLRRVKAPD